MTKRKKRAFFRNRGRAPHQSIQSFGRLLNLFDILRLGAF